MLRRSLFSGLIVFLAISASEAYAQRGSHSDGPIGGPIGGSFGGPSVGPSGFPPGFLPGSTHWSAVGGGGTRPSARDNGRPRRSPRRPRIDYDSGVSMTRSGEGRFNLRPPYPSQKFSVEDSPFRYPNRKPSRQDRADAVARLRAYKQ